MEEKDENHIGETIDLEAVMAAYRALLTDQLIAESILLTSDPETAPRLAGAAVFGFSRSTQLRPTG
jgi:hypothetical protein